MTESFDLIVSNPPYISTPDMDQLVPEVARHEPHLALHGGSDGLDCYRAIAGGLAGILRPDGRLLLEIGADQGDSVPAVFAAAGFRLHGPPQRSGRPAALPGIAMESLTIFVNNGSGTEAKKNGWKAR